MTKIKICGLRRKEDIQYANRCLPDYIGFVFAPSRRQVGADTAAELKELLDPRVRAVGVFVNQEIALIASLCRRGIIDLVQLHGDEDETYIAALRKAAAAPIIRAVAIGAADAAADAAAGARHAVPPQMITAAASADFLLFDAAASDARRPGSRGGGGRTFDWQVLLEIRRHIRQPFFLAGGLNADNLAEAIQLLDPYGVDLSSGVETDGWKDLEKMSAAARIARTQ
jgi:phosphoribosylanthranilate isomerase